MTMTICPVDCEAWRQSASGFLDYGYRQLWAFGTACAARLGAVSEHVTVADGDRLLAAADVRLKSVPLLGSGIAYINGGPLARRGQRDDAERLALAVDALVAEYAVRRGFILRIAPALGPPEWDKDQERIFAAAGFVPAEHPEPYRTIVVDIARPPAEIRQSLGQKWRGHLNRAERRGLTVRSGTDAAACADFGRLYDGLLERKQFQVDLDAAFYARVQAELAPSERLLFHLAFQDDTPVSGVMAGVHGDTAVYLLGATNERGLQMQASYLLQWHTIQAAQQRGCRWYDLCGIDPQGNPGVYSFKQGFGGAERTAPGPFEFRPRGWRPRIALKSERFYRALRQKRARKPTASTPANSPNADDVTLVRSS